ncbi:MAG: hypothetical protein ACXWKP_10970, partial [Bradyrhizobium sp.]
MDEQQSCEKERAKQHEDSRRGSMREGLKRAKAKQCAAVLQPQRVAISSWPEGNFKLANSTIFAGCRSRIG